jgi:glycine/D-amino acid oxidase-like deaminating enzyme
MDVCCGTGERTFDVVVLGSGASGLTAALAAADAGASVAVLEKGPQLGGTAALSGGMLWMPGNGLPGAPEPEADRAAARRYLERLTMGRADAELLDAHLDRVVEVLEFLDAVGGLRFDLIGRFPDYESQMDGASHEGGRSVEPVLYDATQLGSLAPFLRDDPRPPFRQFEYFEIWKTLRNMDMAALRERADAGIVARGRALIAPLLKALADRGATIVADCAGERLVRDGDRVTGVIAGGDRWDATLGVVLACGGFEWNDEMIGRFLSGPVRARCSTPLNTGDGHKMAMAVGADLGGMNEAWWGVMADIPGLIVDGREVQTILTVERSLPGTIVVNRAGERFVNESISYYSIGKVLATFDPKPYDLKHLPAYLVGDAEFFEKHGILGVTDFDALPDWLTAAPTLRELADTLGIDADALEATVARFNDGARDGRDPDFGRGESTYSHYFGDHERDGHPNLAPLVRGPYVALELTCGAIGTKGGARTDVDGRALDPFGEVIDGLYVVGNNSAHPISFGYAGAGSTLGPGMTMAYAAGRALARSAARA